MRLYSNVTVYVLLVVILIPQDVKKKGGVPAVAGAVQKVRAEAERLEVMDKATEILAELLYIWKLLTKTENIVILFRFLHGYLDDVSVICLIFFFYSWYFFSTLILSLSLSRTHTHACTHTYTHTLSLSWTIAKARNTFWVHLRSWWGRCTQSSCPVCLTFSRLSMTMISWRKKPSWSGQMGCVFGCVMAFRGMGGRRSVWHSLHS